MEQSHLKQLLITDAEQTVRPVAVKPPEFSGRAQISGGKCYSNEDERRRGALKDWCGMEC